LGYIRAGILEDDMMKYCIIYLKKQKFFMILLFCRCCNCWNSYWCTSCWSFSLYCFWSRYLLCWLGNT